jgi:hypothetical protein
MPEPQLPKSTIIPINRLQPIADFILDHRGITAREAQPFLALLQSFNEGIALHDALMGQVVDQAKKIAELEAEAKMLREAVEAMKATA